MFPAGSALAQQRGMSIRGVDLDDFPKVALTVSVPDPERFDADQMVVNEDGVGVERLEVEVLDEAQRSVSVVLTIDTSGSMQGEPMEAAKDAAARFIQTIPDHIGIGIVTFSSDAAVALAITDDREEALQVVDGLEASGETALYDAVARSVTLFGPNEQRNIVLLSDGGDTASAMGLEAAVERAEAAEAAIYSVGLRSGEADVTALRRLAAGSGGRYAPAATADLTSVYGDLASELSEQFVVSYESTSEGGGQLAISVSSPQGSDAVLVLAPRVEVPPPAAQPGAEEQRVPLLRGTTGLLIVLVLIFAAVAMLGMMLLGARERHVRQRTLQKELEGRSYGGSKEEEEEWTLLDWIPDSVMHAAEKVADRRGRGKKIELKLERAGWPIKPSEFLALTAVAAVVGLLLGIALSKTLVFGIIAAILGAFGLQIALNFKIHQRLNRLQDQLPDILAILASSLRAGHSFMQALDTVAQEMDGAGGEEFGRVVTEIRLGRAVDEALNDMAERVDSEDFRWAILAVNVQRNVGGNLAEILDTVADTIRERETVRRQVKVLSAEGRISMLILGSLPFLLALYMFTVNRDYLSLLFTTRIGIVMVVAASALMSLGLLWMRRIVRIDV